MSRVAVNNNVPTPHNKLDTNTEEPELYLSLNFSGTTCESDSLDFSSKKSKASLRRPSVADFSLKSMSSI